MRPCIRERGTITYLLYTFRRCVRGIATSIAATDLPLFLRARQFLSKTAIIDQNGPHSYDRLLRLSRMVGDRLVSAYGGKNLAGSRMAFLCPNNVSYVAAQWAIWRNGGIAVPLCPSHPTSMIKYVLEDCQAQMVISSEDMADKLGSLSDSVKCLVLPRHDLSSVSELNAEALDLTAAEEHEKCWDDCEAMIIYTSGTTGKPKGVLTTHRNLRAQITAMVAAWGWSADDCILHVLPLHHIHGIVNALACPLWVGATCYMLPKFQPVKVWEMLTGLEPQLSLFMAVPTIYAKLIQYYKQQNLSASDKEKIKDKCRALRLMVSGSAALPETIMEHWGEISGHTLLERYGMTEIGMALSNPLNGRRLPYEMTEVAEASTKSPKGCVGNPMPGAEVRIVAEDRVLVQGNEHSTTVTSRGEATEGELQVRGPAVFSRYWNKPQATEEAFTEGWFKTGDTAAYKDGAYRILGRTSVDIIKSGGYKISALEIERLLLSHENVLDCAVVGTPDPVWGEKVSAIVVFRQGKEMTLDTLREWATNHMASYQVPAVLKTVKEIPRNIMGKVNKKEIVKTFFF